MRISRLCKKVVELHLDAVWIENPVDLFYLTGQWFSVGKLLVCPDRVRLLLDGRYFERAKKNVPFCEVVLIDQKLSVELFHDLKKIGFDSSHLTVDRLHVLQGSAPKVDWIAIRQPLKDLRICKDAKELAALQKAADLTMEGYRYLIHLLREGVTEAQLALEFEIFCRQRGASKLSFPPIIAFGEHSAYPHYRPKQASLKKDQIILFDLGVVVDDYCADMTRIHFFGRPDPALERFDGLVQEAYRRAFDAAQAGVSVGELDRIVHLFFQQAGVEQFFSHGLGHGVGLDIHEPPIIRAEGEDRNMVLCPGMVFTIEPGLYQPGIGGVRYENTIVLTEHGPKSLNALEHCAC